MDPADSRDFESKFSSRKEIFSHVRCAPHSPLKGLLHDIFSFYYKHYVNQGRSANEYNVEVGVVMKILANACS